MFVEERRFEMRNERARDEVVRVQHIVDQNCTCASQGCHQSVRLPTLVTLTGWDNDNILRWSKSDAEDEMLFTRGALFSLGETADGDVSVTPYTMRRTLNGNGPAGFRLPKLEGVGCSHVWICPDCLERNFELKRSAADQYQMARSTSAAIRSDVGGSQRF